MFWPGLIARRGVAGRPAPATVGRNEARGRDRIEGPAREMALAWPAWGHRKIWALLGADGHQASPATVERALRDHVLLQPAGRMRERRQLARARRNAFLDPPARRNRVWQTDFSELETAGAGVWQLGGLVDYTCKGRARVPGVGDQDLA